jgi:RimJ/RimL family protein N-acetyltransferase
VPILRAPDELVTLRLSLRRFRENDRERYLAIRSHPEVAHYLGHGVDRAEAKTDWFLSTCTQNWNERGVGPWAVTLRETGDLIGHAGFWYLEGFAATGIIYGYDRKYWGQGIATEAARAVIDLGFRRLGFERLIALVEPDNLASRRVCDKLGFRTVREADHRGTRVILHEKLREEA